MPDTVTHPLRASPAAVILAAGSPQAASARIAVPTPIKLSEQRLRLTRIVRRGCFVRLPGASAVFSVRPADADTGAGAAWPDALFLDTQDRPDSAGPIEIADGARLIQGLTGIHPGLSLSPSMERRQWFAAALAGRLAETPLAGTHIVAPSARRQLEETSCLRLTLRSRRHMLSMLARAPVAAWLAFLERSDWSFERSPAQAWLGMESQSTVRIAQHTLPAGVLRTLALGDVIVPDSPLFRPDGEGRIRLGNLHVHVHYAAPNCLGIREVLGKVTPEEMENDTTTEFPRPT